MPVPAPDQPRDLVLYMFETCPYCQGVLRAIAELGLDVPLRDTRKDPEARAELLRVAGRTQVPCLFVDGVPLHESSDIVDWLRRYAEAVAAR